MELLRPRLSACILSWTPALTGSCTTDIAISWPLPVYETVTNLCLRLDIFEFLSHVQDGLKDHYDIKMLTYLMVARLPSTVINYYTLKTSTLLGALSSQAFWQIQCRVSQLCPGAVLQKLDRLVPTPLILKSSPIKWWLDIRINSSISRLVEPLKLTCTTKVKANSVKQEYEKQDELKR